MEIIKLPILNKKETLEELLAFLSTAFILLGVSLGLMYALKLCEQSGTENYWNKLEATSIGNNTYKAIIDMKEIIVKKYSDKKAITVYINPDNHGDYHTGVETTDWILVILHSSVTVMLGIFLLVILSMIKSHKYTGKAIKN